MNLMVSVSSLTYGLCGVCTGRVVAGFIVDGLQDVPGLAQQGRQHTRLVDLRHARRRACDLRDHVTITELLTFTHLDRRYTGKNPGKKGFPVLQKLIIFFSK